MSRPLTQDLRDRCDAIQDELPGYMFVCPTWTRGDALLPPGSVSLEEAELWVTNARAAHAAHLAAPRIRIHEFRTTARFVTEPRCECGSGSHVRGAGHSTWCALYAADPAEAP